MSDPAPALSLRKLRFRYPASAPSNGAWTVDIAHFALAQGEQCLLTGGSGRGKSTLLHLIAGLIEPDQGSISVAGAEIAALHGAKRDLFRGSHIGMIFQTFNLLHGFSALENVMAALMFSSIPHSRHQAHARSLLHALGIEREHADPDRLSVGQQQRIAVARALACNPVLVLADEPTASLDPENARGAMDLIQSACRERSAALLCVSHDPAMPERFARRATLDSLKGEPGVSA